MIRKAILGFAVAFLGVSLSIGAEDLVVGTYAEFPPFQYVDEAGKIVGFDIDVVDAIGGLEGFTPDWSSQAFVALIEGLETGRLDMVASGLTITDARREKVDFSKPYFDVSLVVVVREGEPEITTLEGLKGKRIACLMASTASVVLEKLLGKNNPDVRHFTKYNEIFNELVVGRADAVLVDQPMARAYTKKMGGMRVGSVTMHTEQYGFAVKKGNKALLDRVNAGLKKLQASGAFDRLVEKWFNE